VRPRRRIRSLLVQAHEEIGDRRVEFGETVEAAMAQAAEQPALHDQNAALDLGLVARLARPRRQDGAAVMRRQRLWRSGRSPLRVLLN
jgi:hypothetical protein